MKIACHGQMKKEAQLFFYFLKLAAVKRCYKEGDDGGYFR
jgi:hypothetical protein